MTTDLQPTPRFITACPDCGGAEFFVVESLMHYADVSDGKLIVTSRDKHNEVDAIVCRVCDADVAYDLFDTSELF